VTEFDINAKDEARQAADTRRFYGTYRFTTGGRTFTASFAPGRREATASPEKP